MKSSDQSGVAEVRELCEMLGNSMRDAANAIATHDLVALETAVQGQQQLAAVMAKRRATLATLGQTDPRTLTDLARQSCTLSRVLHRSAVTNRALFSITDCDNELYSLETLPRR